jgi:hypothetical protein
MVSYKNKEYFSKEETEFRKRNQIAAALLLGIKPSEVRPLGNSLYNVVEYENTLSIGTNEFGNTRYKYFFIYQKRATCKHTHSSTDDYLNGYLVKAEDLATIYRNAEESGRVERIVAPRQDGRMDILTRIPYSEFNKSFKFMIK